MPLLRVAVKLPFFLTAEAVLWIVATIASHLFFFHRDSELLLQHERLVDWLWGRKRAAGHWVVGTWVGR